MQNKHKSTKYLDSSYVAFLNGDLDFATRSLNISFNHATNNDWSEIDIQRFLRTLSWLYFYQGRFDKASEQLELAVDHYRKTAAPDKKVLSYLYYNLAECYGRRSRNELCKINFLAALDLLESSVGVEHSSFILLKERYLEVCAAKGIDGDWRDPEQAGRPNVYMNASAGDSLRIDIRKNRRPPASATRQRMYEQQPKILALAAI